MGCMLMDQFDDSALSRHNADDAAARAHDPGEVPSRDALTLYNPTTLRLSRDDLTRARELTTETNGKRFDSEDV